ncbi:MAG: L-serine ammonia-lyase [Prolixibacteraceae bacterium]|nr:L-serine ammonia-lyase [Prolixibacteraceae bacterium]
MESIREIFRIGYGPSSSHTMGPRKAAKMFLQKHGGHYHFRVTLFGSLAATGKGHLTDKAVLDEFVGRKCEILWKPDVFLPRHPNAMTFEALDENEKVVAGNTIYSIGGGALAGDFSEKEAPQVYELQTMDEIISYCHLNGLKIWQFVEENEGSEIHLFLDEVWEIMQDSIKRGLETDGILPGGLKLSRKSHTFKQQSLNYSGPFKKRINIFSYALAVAEENASGGKIVTAPTCGSCGVLPAVLYYFKKVYKIEKDSILRALATAGLIGNLVKTNASISGAEVGCQGEIGVACAMASGAATQMMGGSISQIEYSAEMGLEHHLGLTCDPVAGLVQIPCIERNAFAAQRALAHNTFAMMSDGRHRISFDEVGKTMYETGINLKSKYKETSEGGLAVHPAMPKN